MILLPVGLNKLTSEVITHPFKVKMQPFVHLFSKDQMQVKCINDMSFCSKILHNSFIFSIFKYIC